MLVPSHSSIIIIDSLVLGFLISGRKQPLMENDCGLMATFNSRWPSREEYLWWKTSPNERQPSMDEKLQEKKLSMKETLGWKTTFKKSVSGILKELAELEIQ